MLGPVGGVYLSALMLAPVVALILMSVLDAVRISHRVVGPLRRFRKAIRAITAGEEVELIQLRDGDYPARADGRSQRDADGPRTTRGGGLKAPKARQDQGHREPAEAAPSANRFWQDSPLPRASMKTGHYETITGADSLALALVELHLSILHITAVRCPPNTIDR